MVWVRTISALLLGAVSALAGDPAIPPSGSPPTQPAGADAVRWRGKPVTPPIAPEEAIVSMREALELPGHDAAIAAAEKLVELNAKEAEAALMHVALGLQEPPRTRAIALLAMRADNPVIRKFLWGPWPTEGASKGPIERQALKMVLEMEDKTYGCALERLEDGRKEEAEVAMMEIFGQLNPRGDARITVLRWLSDRPDSPVLREFLLRWAAEGDDYIRTNAVGELIRRCGDWPPAQKGKVVKLALARLELKNEGGGGTALWLARQGVPEALPVLKRRLERVAKQEGPAKRYEIFGMNDLRSYQQGQIVVALAILGEMEARCEIRDSLAQDLDAARLAWGLWAATETGDPSWAPLVAEHLDDGRTILDLYGIHSHSGDSSSPPGQAHKLRLDALAVQVLASLCRPSFSFVPGPPGKAPEHEYPSVPHPRAGGWILVPRGYTPAQMKEVRDWWVRHREQWVPRPTSAASRPATR